MDKKILSVKELTDIIKCKFNSHLNEVFTIKGEVQNLSKKFHYYLSIKDEQSQIVIGAMIWNKTIHKNGYDNLETGDIITVSGKLSMYNVKNEYKFCIFRMLREETSETDYKRKYEMFKKKGYFDKKLPFDKTKIKRIGLITSTQGEAINDFKKTLSERFFPGDIYIHNVNVQGVNCANDVINAINYFEKKRKNPVDVILITRGGGSTIDMDEFNNIDLIERIYKRKKPIICAIGHEKDMCLCDYVCDLRTSTPTSLALEVSDDYSKIHNKIHIVFEAQKSFLRKNVSDILFDLKDKKTKIYQTLTEHKPSGFYFGNNHINKLIDFNKLSKEQFTVQLEDGIIEFKIRDFKVREKFNKKYTYSKYIELYNGTSKYKVKDKDNLNKYIEKYNKLEKSNKFGSKEHFEVYDKILSIITYNINQINNLDIIKKTGKNYELIKPRTFEELILYKKHINYLQNLFDKNFEGIKPLKLKGQDNQKLCQEYLEYNPENGISEYYISLYLGICKMKAKYYKPIDN
jgi:exodeoxyribonuclease VII large subunit